MLKQRKALYEQLREAREEKERLENHPVIIAWHKYQALTVLEQQVIEKRWEQYYRDVQETPIYLLYQAQRRALAQGQTSQVKALAEEARLLRESGNNVVLQQPSSVDPAEFFMGIWVRGYRNIIDGIKKLETELYGQKGEEIKEIFQGEKA